MRTVERYRSKLDLSKFDWRRIDATTDQEIARQASQDRDTAPVLTAEQLIAAGR